MLKKRLFGVMILMFGIMLFFSLIGCDSDPDSDNPLEGTWVGVDSNWVYIFSGSNFTILDNSGSNRVNRQKGTFSLNAAKTRFTQNATHDWENGSWVSKTFNGGSCDIVISDNSITFSNADSGWFTGSRTYRKQ